MRMSKTALAGALLLATAAQAADPTVCDLPGASQLDDPAGDQLLPQDDYDLVSLHLAQPASSDGTLVFTFTLKTTAVTVSPPLAAWFVSFKAPDGRIRGVRADTDATGEASFTSYQVETDNDGEQLGQFVVDGTQKPLLAGSGFDADAGTITFVVRGADIGVKAAGEKIEKFNAGVIQLIGHPAVVSLSLNGDAMPDDLAARTGSFTVNANGSCPAADKSDDAKAGVVDKFGGAFGAGLSLIGLLGAALRRRRAA